MKKLIAISLSPNTQKDDVLRAIGVLFSPWNYFGSSSVKHLERWFRNFFNVSYAISFSTARAVLVGLLKSFDVQNGDEILLQSFTCVAVPDAVMTTGAKPVYVDVLLSLTIDSKDLEKKITKKSKGIIVQHTLGIPTDMGDVLRIAKKHKLFVIEDCAHTIGGMFNNKKLGTLGDGAIFSFGRDKAFSSVFGGMAITNNEEVGKKLRAFQKNLKNPSIFWTIQQLFHPIAFSIILPLYGNGLGKLLLVILQKIHALSFPVLPIEKKGKVAPAFVKKYPNSLAILALGQLAKLQTYNKHREEVAQVYIHGLDKNKYEFAISSKVPYLRFPIFSSKRDEIIKRLRAKYIYLGNWYANAIDPKGTDFATINYDSSLCPNAEKFAKQIINLPTHQSVSKKDAEKIVAILNAC